MALPTQQNPLKLMGRTHLTPLPPERRWDLLLLNPLQRVIDSSEMGLCFIAKLVRFRGRNLVYVMLWSGRRTAPFVSIPHHPCGAGPLSPAPSLHLRSLLPAGPS